MRHSTSDFSKEEIAWITRFQHSQMDRCIDDPHNPDYIVDGSLLFPSPAKREMQVWQGLRAMQYIAAIVNRSYPFQLRQSAAFDLWCKFCAVWDETGDMSKAMRAI